MTNTIVINRRIGKFNSIINVDGDKSLSIRWILFSSLSDGISIGKNLLFWTSILYKNEYKYVYFASCSQLQRDVERTVGDEGDSASGGSAGSNLQRAASPRLLKAVTMRRSLRD